MAPEKDLVNARYFQIDFGKTEGWTRLARTTKTGLSVDLIDLDLVTAVAETGSITHGAARARLSLPAASGRIRSLEHTLGVTLFDRGRRGVALTPAGHVLLRHARSVCHAVGQLRTELDEYAQGHGATVRVQANTAAT